MNSSIFNEVDLALHEHCATCVTVFRCQYLDAHEQYGCRVIHCPNECGWLFHACKTEEHLLLCPLTRVPCVNSGYGCPLWMQRKDLAHHLPRCPASVLYCKMERNRRPLSDRAKKKLKTLAGKIDLRNINADSDALDLFLALSDQNKINESYHYSRQIRKLHTNFFCKHHPQLPMLRMQDSSCAVEYSVEGDTSEEEEKKRRKFSVSAVARECIICKIDPSSQHLHMLGSQVNFEDNDNLEAILALVAKKVNGIKVEKDTTSEFYRKNQLLVDITPEFLPAHCQKPRNYYTVVCSEVVRRDQHAHHYANIHADTISALDGWAQVRCPLALYGCQEFHTRLVPHFGDSRVVYNTAIDALVLSAKNNPSDIFSGPSDYKFTFLPNDILYTVCSYLDSASLNCLSMTCQRMREICRELLCRSGIVQLVWSKLLDETGRSRWCTVGKKWTFGNCFEFVPKWRVAPAGRLVDHIQKCPYYDPVVHKDPIPVLTFVKSAPILY